METERKQRLLDAGINVNAALNRFMGNEKMMEKYLGRFLAEKSYAALKGAIDANDQPAAQAAVHTLKSVCGSIGCEDMQAQVVEQEKAMRSGDWAGAVAMMPDIEKTYNTICEALQA